MIAFWALGVVGGDFADCVQNRGDRGHRITRRFLGKLFSQFC